MPAPNLDAQAPAQYDKSDVNYRHYESCKTCVNFNGRVYCAKVRGHVSPDAVCNMWAMSENTTNKTGKEIIMDEYEKSRGVK